MWRRDRRDWPREARAGRWCLEFPAARGDRLAVGIGPALGGHVRSWDPALSLPTRGRDLRSGSARVNRPLLADIHVTRPAEERSLRLADTATRRPVPIRRRAAANSGAWPDNRSDPWRTRRACSPIGRVRQPGKRRSAASARRNSPTVAKLGDSASICVTSSGDLEISGRVVAFPPDDGEESCRRGGEPDDGPVGIGREF